MERNGNSGFVGEDGHNRMLKNMEVIDKEPRIRWKLSQTMKGIRWSEFTVRGETLEEQEALTKETLKRLKEIEKYANGL